ncbi:MAG: hypothetical protein ACTSV7_00445 [Candidatus Baldrarchaeia archaeon]
MYAVFVLSKLRPKVDPEKYENWVRQYDYPTSKKLGSITHYRVYRVTGTLEGSSEYSYIEHITVTNIEEYKRDISTPIGKELLKQWSSFIKEAKVLFTEVIE